MGYKRLQFKSLNEWLGGRIIGGSGASAIIGESPYQSNLDYYKALLKRKHAHISYEEVDREESDNPAIWFGNNAEKHIRELFRLLNINKYEVIAPKTIENDGYVEMLVSTENEFMTATLDGELVEKDTGRKGILEIKTANTLSVVMREKWRNQIPTNYLVQVLHYLMVKDDTEFAKVFAFLKDSDDRQHLMTYHIERKDFEEEIAVLKAKEIEFYNCLEIETEPPLILNL